MHLAWCFMLTLISDVHMSICKTFAGNLKALKSIWYIQKHFLLMWHTQHIQLNYQTLINGKYKMWIQAANSCQLWLYAHYNTLWYFFHYWKHGNTWLCGNYEVTWRKSLGLWRLSADIDGTCVQWCAHFTFVYSINMSPANYKINDLFYH